MILRSVVLARALAFVETFDLNPLGKVFYPELIRGLVERYHFQKFPQTFQEMDEAKGIEFFEGIADATVIQKFTIFSTLLAVETRLNTAESERIIADILNWSRERFGLTYSPDVIRNRAYVSTVVFNSSVPILSTQPLLNLAQRTGEIVSKLWNDPVKYEPLGIFVGHDPLSRKNAIANFNIQRRSESPFSLNKYLSEAPLPTDAHLELLQEYEKEVAALFRVRIDA